MSYLGRWWRRVQTVEVREPKEHSRGRGEFKVWLEMKARATTYPKSNAKQLKGFEQSNDIISLWEIILAAVEEMHWRRGTQVGKRGTHY